MATVTLRLSPRRAHVRTARLVAAAMARRSGVSEELLDEVRLAVGEACARAVQIHERNGDGGPVIVEMVDGVQFELVVHDGLAGGALRSVDAQLPDVGGWLEPQDEHIGLALLDAMVDDITIEQDDTGSGTRVRMRWPTT
ncbi:MAG: ATP-binding protein [Actinobacteria bacterium]|nr:ATP-binding protein [Actinomycetota bacterium]MBI3686361.1 ATP-binding protein [Actinomycetota bacterium]